VTKKLTEYDHLAFYFDLVGRPHNFFSKQGPTFVNPGLVLVCRSTQNDLGLTGEMGSKWRSPSTENIFIRRAYLYVGRHIRHGVNWICI